MATVIYSGTITYRFVKISKVFASLIILKSIEEIGKIGQFEEKRQDSCIIGIEPKAQIMLNIFEQINRSIKGSEKSFNFAVNKMREKKFRKYNHLR